MPNSSEAVESRNYLLIDLVRRSPEAASHERKRPFQGGDLARNELLWRPMPALRQSAARDEPTRSAGPVQSHVLIATRRSK